MITDQGIAVPDDMTDALEHVPGALRAFLALRSTRQRQYVDWVGKADGADARAARLAELPEHVLGDGAVATR